MNDLLFLHLHHGEGGNAPVAWSAITPIVEAAESLVNDFLTQVRRSRAPMTGSYRSTEPAIVSRLLLAGPPRQGSIVLPFLLEIPSSINAVFVVQTGPLPDSGSAFSEYLGTLVDLITLGHFVRDALFGERGLVAQRTDQEAPVSSRTLEARAIEDSARFVEALTPSIDRLLQAAEATGCEKIEIQVNDQACIQLVMDSRRRRSSLLARRARPSLPPGFQPNYVFDPQSPPEMTRASEEVINVKLASGEYEAMLFRVASPSDQHVILVWGAQLSPPNANGTVEVVGRRVEREDVEVLDDVPVSFEKASDIFFVEKARPSWS